MIASYNLGFCQMDIHDNHAVTTINEGVTILPEHNKIFLQIVDTHFRNKPFIYISNRVYSYAINPIVYLETAKVPNLAGFAVVSRNPEQKMLTQVEKAFLGKEFFLFKTLDEALLWKDGVLQELTSFDK